jgi:hypothetical protein
LLLNHEHPGRNDPILAGLRFRDTHQFGISERRLATVAQTRNDRREGGQTLFD